MFSVSLCGPSKVTLRCYTSICDGIIIIIMNVKIVTMMMIERECEVLIYVDLDLQYLGKTKKSKNVGKKYN